MKTARLFLGLFYIALFWGKIVIEIQLVFTYLAAFVELLNICSKGLTWLTGISTL